MTRGVHVRLDVSACTCSPGIPTVRKEAEAGDCPEAPETRGPASLLHAAVGKQRPVSDTVGREDGHPRLSSKRLACIIAHAHTRTHLISQGRMAEVRTGVFWFVNGCTLAAQATPGTAEL